MSKTIHSKCESINQNLNQFTARFIVSLPDAQPVDNKLPVKSVITAQFAGTDSPGYIVGKNYDITISESKT